jgi:hypothetical protein
VYFALYKEQSERREKTKYPNTLTSYIFPIPKTFPTSVAWRRNIFRAPNFAFILRSRNRFSPFPSAPPFIPMKSNSYYWKVTSYLNLLPRPHGWMAQTFSSNTLLVGQRKIPGNVLPYDNNSSFRYRLEWWHMDNQPRQLLKEIRWAANNEDRKEKMILMTCVCLF